MTLLRSDQRRGKNWFPVKTNPIRVGINASVFNALCGAVLFEDAKVGHGSFSLCAQKLNDLQYDKRVASLLFF